MGDFHPTEEGESLMPIATGVSPAYRALHKVSMEIFGNAREERTEGEYAACQRALRRTTEYADVEEAHVHCESLRLELRGPNGAVIPTEWIAFQDTEYLLALADEAEEEFDISAIDPLLADEADRELLEAIERDAVVIDEWFKEEDWGVGTHGSYAAEDSTFPRYQIQVELIEEWDVP